MTNRPNIDFDVTHIPDELKAIRHWVVWKPVRSDEKQKWDKPPISPYDGGLGSSTDPTQWTTLEHAVDVARSNEGHGIGFVLTPEIGIVGLDFDHAWDPSQKAWIKHD